MIQALAVTPINYFPHKSQYFQMQLHQIHNIKHSLSILVGGVLCLLFLLWGEPDKAFAILLVYYCIKRGKLDGRFYSPYYLLIVSLVSFIAYYPKMGPYIMMELPTSSITLILLCFLALILGFNLVRWLGISPIARGRKNENFWIVLLIGCIPTVLSYILYGNTLAMQGDELLETKEKFSLPMIGQLAYFLPASIIVACKNNNSKQIAIAVGLSVLAAFMTLTKSALVVMGVFLLMGLLKFKPSFLENKCISFLKRYTIIWLPCLVLYFFMFNNNVRHDAWSTTSMNYIESSGSRVVNSNTDFAEGMFLNYLYFCTPWGNLEYNIERNPQSGHGANTFAQFGKKMGVEVQTVEKIEPAAFNTHTFITDFYLDFGYAGSIVASFILGLIIYFFYRKFGLSDDSLLLSYYALIGFATVMLFFSNHFVMGYLLNYLITFGGYYLVSRFMVK